MEEGKPVELQLRSLASLIRNGNQDIEERMGKLRSSVLGIVADALLIGGYLIQAKERIQHGHWERFIREDCGMSESTANNYRKLVRFCGANPGIENGKSYGDLVRLMNGESVAETNAPEPVAVEVRGVRSASRLATFARANPISFWPAEAVDKLRAELAPVAIQLWPDGVVQIPQAIDVEAAP